jgi:5'-nucleotidase
MPHILITNDDGIHADGLKALVAGLKGLGKISISAPSRERSAAAQSLTLRQPIICERRGENKWSVEGTPADSVIVGLLKLLDEPPHLVVSGINRGANMGENVYYSGTVGAAREATIHNIPAIAVSLACRGFNDICFDDSARFARALAQIILKEGLPKEVLLNVNVPQNWTGGVQFVRQSKKITRNALQEGTDPRGRLYFWLHEQQIDQDIDPETDYAAVRDGAIAVTPLHLDHTHATSLNHLSHWSKELEHAMKKA